MILRWIRDNGEFTALGLFLLALVIAVLTFAGVDVLSFFDTRPRFEKSEEERQSERDTKREVVEKRRAEQRASASTVWAAYPGRSDPVNFDALDSTLVPLVDRYSWQPEGLIAILGSHSGRHSGGSITGVCWLSEDRIASGGTDGYVRLWQAETLRELEALPCPARSVVSVACSPDGSVLAACGDDEEGGCWLRVWRLADERVEESVTLAWSGTGTCSVTFSPDGRWLALGGGKGELSGFDFLRRADHGWVQLWAVQDDPSAPLREMWTFTDPQAPVQALAFSADGRTLAAGGADKAIRLWNLADGNVASWRTATNWSLGIGGIFLAVGVLLRLRSKALLSAKQTSRFGVLVALSLIGLGGSSMVAGLALWRVGPELSWTTKEIRQSQVTALAYSPDGRLASGDVDGDVWLWDIVGTKITASARGDLAREGDDTPVLALAFSPDGKTLVSGHRRKADQSTPFRVWKIGDVPELTRGAGLPSKDISAIAFSRDGGHLVAHDAFASRIRRWAFQAGEWKEQTLDNDGRVFDAAWVVGEGLPLLTVRDKDRTLERWEPSGGRLFSVPFGDHLPLLSSAITGYAHCPRDGRYQCTREVDFANDGRALVSWAVGREVRLWDLHDTAREIATLKDFDGLVTWAALGGRSGPLAVGTSTGTVYFWRFTSDIKPGRREVLKGLTASVDRLELRSNGKVLIARDYLDEVKIWDISGSEPRCVVEEKRSVKLTADEKKWLAKEEWKYRLHAIVKEDRVAVEREEPDGERKTIIEWSPPGEVIRTQFSGDGRHLIVTNANGTVYVVRLDPKSADDRLLAACEAILAREPGNVSALIERAKIHTRRDKWDLALEDASRAVGKDPACAEGWWLRGLAHSRREEHVKAEQDFMTLLKFQPQNAAAWYRRGLCRAERGDHAGARQDFAAALKIDPDIAQHSGR